MSTVAICIPTFNQASYLAESVRSAFTQDYPHLEIWLSDDASTDRTPEVVADLQKEFPALKPFRQPKNLGMGGNPKWVVRQPKTEFIVKLDSDDRLHPAYVSKLLGLLQTHERAAYGHAAVNQINDAGQVTRARRLARPGGFQSAEESLRGLVSNFRVAANICMFRRAALEEIDFYRDDMAFCDDWDAAVRIADAGWGNVYCPEILADYRVWDDANNVRARRKMLEVEGSRRVYADALTPAFRRRQWDVTPLTAARQQWAINHSIALTSPLFAPAERVALTDALRQLGGSPRLERRLRLYRMGFGPWLQRRDSALLRTKDIVKKLLRR